MASGETGEIKLMHKSSVRAVLLSQIGGVLLRNFTSDYKNLLNEPVPYTNYGFKNLEGFLRAMPDIVRFEYSHSNQDWRLFGIGDPNTFMSGHAKKAQGKPGQDKDPVDGANKRIRRGRCKQYTRTRGPQSSAAQARRPPQQNGPQFRPPQQNGPQFRPPQQNGPQFRPPQQNGLCGYEDLTPDFRNLYSLCCPLGRKNKEDILKELKTVAEIEDVRETNGLLFTRYIHKSDAIKVLEAFKAKYNMSIARQRVSQVNPPPGRVERKQTHPVTGVGTNQASPFSDGGITSQSSPFSSGGGNSTVSPFINGWGTAGPSGAGGVTSQTSPCANVGRISQAGQQANRNGSGQNSAGAQDARKGILDQYVGPGVEIYIGNIPGTLTQLGLMRLLSNIRVNDLRIKAKDDKRFAFCLIPTREEADCAVNRLNGHFFSGRHIVCRLAKPDPVKTKSHAGPISGPHQTGPIPSRPHGGPMSSFHDSFIPDPDALEALLFIEVPRDQAIAALKANNNNLQDASVWLVNNTEDLWAALKDMDATAKKPESRCAAFFPDPKNLDELMVNGIEREHAIQALRVSNNNLEEAADWIMTHMAELGISPGLEETQPVNTPGPGEAQSREKKATFVPDPRHLEELLGCGIEREAAIEALRVSNNDLDAAANRIIAHTKQSEGEIQQAEQTVSVSANALAPPREETAVDLPSPVPETPAQPSPPIRAAADDLPPLEEEADDAPPPLEDDDDDVPPPLEEEDDDVTIPDLEQDDYDGDLTDQSFDSQSISTVGSVSQRVSIFVGRFPLDTKQIDLLELFSRYNPLKIKMINNFDPLRKTFAFVVLPNTELAEQAIEEMDRCQYHGKFLQVGRAFIKHGYTEASDDEEIDEPEVAPEDPLLQDVPESVSFYHILMTEVWPNAKILHTQLINRLPILVTCIVDDHFFFGQVLKFVQEQTALELINEELDNVCKARPPEKRVPVHRCAANYNGNWYRAYNMGEMDSNQHAVMFLDYGNIERLDPKELRRPELDMWMEPPVAKPFQLINGSLSEYEVTEGVEVNVSAIHDGTPRLSTVTRVEMSGQNSY